jgi:hypothetical protein
MPFDGKYLSVQAVAPVVFGSTVGSCAAAGVQRGRNHDGSLLHAVSVLRDQPSCASARRATGRLHARRTDVGSG